MKSEKNKVGIAMGRLMKAWGFRESHGKIWAALYIEDTPMDARTLVERTNLGISIVHDAISRLKRIGLIELDHVNSEKRFFYRANNNIENCMAKIFAEKTDGLVDDLISAIEHNQNKDASAEKLQKLSKTFSDFSPEKAFKIKKKRRK